CSRWLWYHPVLQIADALNLHPHHVTYLQPPRRLHACGHATTCTSRDDIARLERPRGGGVFDHLFPVVNHVAGVVMLAYFAIDSRTKRQIVGIGDLVGGDDPGTERAMRVPGLAQVIVDMALVIAHRAVIEDRVAHHDQRHLCARDPPTTPPYDSRELQLVVELLRLARQPHSTVRRIDASHQAEIQRRGGGGDAPPA